MKWPTGSAPRWAADVVTLKSPREIETMARAGRIVAGVLRLMRERARPGLTTEDLDALAEEFIRSHAGATPSFKGLYDFPKRVYTAATATASKATAENLRGAVRRAMRLAAEQGRVPVIFPRAWDDDPWELATWRYFPDGAPCISPATVAVYRSSWRDYAREAKEFFAADPYRLDPVLPDMIDAEMLDSLRSAGAGVTVARPGAEL